MSATDHSAGVAMNATFFHDYILSEFTELKPFPNTALHSMTRK